MIKEHIGLVGCGGIWPSLARFQQRTTHHSLTCKQTCSNFQILHKN